MSTRRPVEAGEEGRVYFKLKELWMSHKREKQIYLGVSCSLITSWGKLNYEQCCNLWTQWSRRLILIMSLKQVKISIDLGGSQLYLTAGRMTSGLLPTELSIRTPASEDWSSLLFVSEILLAKQNIRDEKVKLLNAFLCRDVSSSPGLETRTQKSKL